MQLKSLTISGYRNLVPQRVGFPNRVTVVVGKNGQGKTNLIEAIYLLSHTRSFRNVKTKELLTWSRDESLAEIEAEVESGDGEKTVTLRLSSNKRQFSINGKSVESAAAFYGTVKSVEFSPTDLELIFGAPKLRRTYLDKILALTNPNYVEHFVRYQRALKQRNATLRSEEPTLLTAWENTLIESGLFIAKERNALVKNIEPLVVEQYRNIATELASEKPSLVFESDFFNEGTLLEPGAVSELYRTHREKDLARGSTTVGAHRDGLEIYIGRGTETHEAKSAASQGQARSIALALKIASVYYIERSTGEAPIILLDDVESELDRSRRKALLALIGAQKNQVILTTTDASEIPGELKNGAFLLSVNGGLLTSQESS